MTNNRSTKVTKHDGSVEMFQPGKLRRCLAVAMRGCGYDDRCADALARAVAIHVSEWPQPRPPTTEYIFRCVREVLRETQLEDVSREMGRHRRTRSLKRKRLVVVDTRRPTRGPREWQKSVVVRALLRRYGLRAEVARILAGEIEQRVLGLNYGAVSTALVGELIRNELMAWGLADEAVAVRHPIADAEVELGREVEKES